MINFTKTTDVNGWQHYEARDSRFNLLFGIIFWEPKRKSYMFDSHNGAAGDITTEEMCVITEFMKGLKPQ